MKGITPVIATILLVLIVVALGGVFAAWTSRVASTTTEAGTQQVETVTGQLQKSIAIDSVDCANGHIYVRNTGSVQIAQTEIGVYDDGAMVTINSCTTCPIAVNTIADLNVGALSGAVKVVVGGNSATYSC